ncbi:VOC family protein [Flavisphingomonas formosensis]|uniref:VOC family protein n=1 Tax=Flavisphingomonas formosensis TaxID=861534 RepID=UPI001E51C227|nr:VOC family protein [Sphingomonas formosensis]
MTEAADPFCWYELVTTDHDAASAFYEKVAGWAITDSGMADRRYSILSAGANPLGGIMSMDVPRPFWLGYVAVDDVDAYVGKVREAGGSVHRAAEDIPGVGRFAVVADPQGAAFVLFKGSSSDMPPLPAQYTPGSITWHELHTSDREGAFSFYAGLFGWTKDQGLDMGDMGIYQLIAVDGNTIGAIFADNQAPRPHWLYYIGTDDIDAALKRAEDAGATISMGPHEVPGGAWIFVGSDPQGGVFAMVGQRKLA